MSDKSVWVVSSGSYSDYRVPVIEKAERCTVYGIKAVITDDGTVREESVRDREEWNVNPICPERLRPVTVRWVRAPIYHQAGRLEAYGTDRERVRKTFSDLKAQLIADPALRQRREFTR